jgi:hypothetical protein
MMTDRLRYVASATILRDAMVRVQRIATGTGDADLYAIASAALDEATELESVEGFTYADIAPALARARARRKGPPAADGGMVDIPYEGSVPAGDLVHGPVGRPDTGHRPHCRWQWSECTCWSGEEGEGDE